MFVSVSVGMGLLAGSTRTFTVVGKCDIRDTIAETTKTLKASILMVTGKCLCLIDWMLHFFFSGYINVIVVTSSVDSGVIVDVVFPLTSSTFKLIITRKCLESFCSRFLETLKQGCFECIHGDRLSPLPKKLCRDEKRTSYSEGKELKSSPERLPVTVSSASLNQNRA